MARQDSGDHTIKIRQKSVRLKQKLYLVILLKHVAWDFCLPLVAVRVITQTTLTIMTQ